MRIKAASLGRPYVPTLLLLYSLLLPCNRVDDRIDVRVRTLAGNIGAGVEGTKLRYHLLGGVRNKTFPKQNVVARSAAR
jgi:hypothetical protein